MDLITPVRSGSVCNECMCEKGQLLVRQWRSRCGEATDPGNPLREGLVCDSCVCKKDTDPGTGGLTRFHPIIEVKCVSFADEAEKLYYDSLNETYFLRSIGKKATISSARTTPSSRCPACRRCCIQRIRRP